MTLYSVPEPAGEGTEGTTSSASPGTGFAAQVRAPARSTRPRPPSTSPGEDVHEPPPGEVTAVALPDLGGWIGALLDRPGTLLHARPPSFRQAHARHVECASHHQWAVTRLGRMLFGYLHMAVIMPALRYLEWATDSPLRLSIHALLGVVVWLTLLLGGYL